jgi:hypothetical protein
MTTRPRNPTPHIGTIKLSLHMVSEAVVAEEVILAEAAAETNEDIKKQVGTAIESPPRLHLESIY